MKKPNTDSEDAWIRGADDRNCQNMQKIRPSAVFQDLLEPAHGKSLSICLRSILNKHWKVYLCHSEFRSLTGKRRFRRQSASVSGWTDTTGNSSGLATITSSSFYSSRGRLYKEIFTPIRICQMGRSRSAAL